MVRLADGAVYRVPAAVHVPCGRIVLSQALRSRQTKVRDWTLPARQGGFAGRVLDVADNPAPKERA